MIYRTEGWLRKNTDTLHEDLQVHHIIIAEIHKEFAEIWAHHRQLCMASSTSPLLKSLFSIGTINAITGGQKGGSKRAGSVNNHRD